MTLDAYLVLAITLLAMAAFISEKVPMDMIAMGVLGLLVVCGLISPQKALSGFSNPATVAVAAMFVLSAGLQATGALNVVARSLGRIKNYWLLILSVMVLSALSSAFINNTAVVAICLPMVLTATARLERSPSKILMPLSFAAQMGGVCTLIGTSTNLLVHGLAKDLGEPGFSLFEFAPVGLACMVAGFVYMLTVGQWLLPETRDNTLVEAYGLGEYLTELRLNHDSKLIGRSISNAKLSSEHGVSIMALLRDEKKVWSPNTTQLEAGDVMLLRGEWRRLEEVMSRFDLEVAPEFRLKDESIEKGNASLIEVMVAPNAPIDGHTLSELDFYQTHKTVVLAIQRKGAMIRNKLSAVRLSVGDLLLLAVPSKDMKDLRKNRNFVILNERERHSIQGRAAWAVGILAATITTAALGWLPISISAIIGVLLMVATRCLDSDAVYQTVEWKVIFLLAGLLPLGIAMNDTGAAKAIADMALTWVDQSNPIWILATMYLLSMVLTELMSNAAAAAVLAPIAVASAHGLGMDPKPLLVAVTVAASTSFATPVGYQTNTMVYSAGGYKFSDFLRVGMPLNLLFFIICMVVIPLIWPLHH